jgi:predicted DsbA family dithiol-disulfide isomerase
MSNEVLVEENMAVANQPLVRIDVWSDYNCPWCRLGTAGLDALQETDNVEVVWHSYELRPAGSPPMPAEYRARIEQGWQHLNRVASETYGIELKNRRLGVDSRPALIGAKYAESLGMGAAYHEHIMRAYWDDARDIGDMNELVQIAQEVGLDADAYRAALENPAFIREVDEDIRQAATNGISGVPAMVFAGKYLVSGAQPPDVLRQVTAKVREIEKQQ